MTANAVIAAAAHLKRMYALAPFASCPPVPAALAAALSVPAGGSEQAGYWAVAIAAWLASAWATSRAARNWNAPSSAGWKSQSPRHRCAGEKPWFLMGLGVPEASAPFRARLRFGLVRISGAPGLAGAFLLIAPSRLSMLLFDPDLPRLLFWSAAAFIAAEAAARRRPKPAGAARTASLLLFAAGSHPLSVNFIDALAAVELLALVLIRTRAPIALRALAPITGAVSLASAFWYFSVQSYYGYNPGPPPADLQSWLTENSGGRRVFQSRFSLGLIQQPGLSLAAATIQSPGSARESLLWLRAFAAEYLVSADWPKYHSSLDPVFENGEWFVYRLPAPNPAEAVLVSLPGWTKLPEIRGLRDSEALSAYLDWSGRPEQAGIVWDNPREATIAADLGEFDAILVRRAAISGWSAALVDAKGNESHLPIGSDPLGYIVLAPRVEGPVTIRLSYQPGLMERLWPSPPGMHELLIGAFPAISPNGIIDAARSTPGPFPPGAIVSIYGSGFVERATRVLIGGQPVVPLYTGPNQLNVRLPESLAPGKVDVIVEVGGARSIPSEIEVAAQ